MRILLFLAGKFEFRFVFYDKGIYIYDLFGSSNFYRYMFPSDSSITLADITSFEIWDDFDQVKSVSVQYY